MLGLGREDNDLDASCWSVDRGALKHSRRMGAEADGGNLSTLEPAGILDRVAVDEVFPHRLGLFLSENFCQIFIVPNVGERGDYNFGSGLNRTVAPPTDLVEAC